MGAARVAVWGRSAGIFFISGVFPHILHIRRSLPARWLGANDEWKLPVYATRDTVLEKGDRICQFRIYETQPPIEFEECGELSATDRGGFGSTGRK